MAQFLVMSPSSMKHPILNLAFYHFNRVEDPNLFRETFRTYCSGKPFRGTLIFGFEGLNGVLSGEEAAIRDCMAFIRSFPEFAKIDFKESGSNTITFPRMLVKVKKEIIPIGDASIDPLQKTGARVKPLELKQWLDDGQEVVLIDTRNDYEVDYGTFTGAQVLDLRYFRDFPEKLKSISDETKKKKVVMFCTGGIRCEKATAVAMNQGFENVFQLDGGILKYFEDCGNAHYDGGCFVFDRRIALNPDLTEIFPDRPEAKLRSGTAPKDDDN